MSSNCLVCGSSPTDRCHVKTKGSGGPDQPWNIMNLCRRHHIQQHAIGIVTFFKKNHSVQYELAQKGWTLISEFGRDRLWNPNLAGNN